MVLVVTGQSYLSNNILLEMYVVNAARKTFLDFKYFARVFANTLTFSYTIHVSLHYTAPQKKWDNLPCICMCKIERQGQVVVKWGTWDWA